MWIPNHWFSSDPFFPCRTFALGTKNGGKGFRRHRWAPKSKICSYHLGLRFWNGTAALLWKVRLSVRNSFVNKARKWRGMKPTSLTICVGESFCFFTGARVCDWLLLRYSVKTLLKFVKRLNEWMKTPPKSFLRDVLLEYCRSQSVKIRKVFEFKKNYHKAETLELAQESIALIESYHVRMILSRQFYLTHSYSCLSSPALLENA